MAVITIDGKYYEVVENKNLLEICLSEGLDLPYFCWHPAMGSVGACRQCAAKQFASDEDQRGRLVTACMTHVKDGQIFSIQDEQAKQLRAAVIESLMTNHPHDCPVCEEGGECHLQDMTEMSGHTFRRYRGKKRTHRNQYLGPLINHEMNRCISCYRCVRFYSDYVGGKDLAAMSSHNHVYFGREKDGVLASEFAGNLVEVCPTGVFTDKPFSKHYSRKWDLQTAPSICTHCAVGCNTTPGSRYGTIRRVVNRYHSKINGYFLCDRGRFGYGYNHHPLRLKKIESDIGEDKNSGEQTLLRIAHEVATGKSKVIGVGSPRASLENNFALREFVGKEQFYNGVTLASYKSHQLLVNALIAGGLDIANIKQVEQADAIIILGEDIAETAPRLSLALRQTIGNVGKQACSDVGILPWQDAAVRSYSADKKTPIFIASLSATRLDDISQYRLHTDPGKIAQIGFYIAALIKGESSEVSLNAEQQQWANAAIKILKNAKRPLVLSGSGYQQIELTRASLAVYSAIKNNQSNTLFYYAFPQANSLGLSILSHSGNFQRNSLASSIHRSSSEKSYVLQDLVDVLREAGRENKRRVLMILENDLYRQSEKSSVDELLKEVDELIVMDHSHSTTVEMADCIIPVCTALESQGTLVNNEGRAQRFYSVMPSTQDVIPSWQWLSNTAKRFEANAQGSGQTNTTIDWSAITSWQYCDDVSLSIAKTIPILDAIVKLNTADPQPLARQTHRSSGRTAIDANVSVKGKKPEQDFNSPFTYSMEGNVSHGPLENSVWSPGWNSNQAIHKYQQEVAGALAGGESGICLFSFDSEAMLPNFAIPEESNDQMSSSILIYPLQHVFGSDELSMKAQEISELAPASCLLMNPSDAQHLDVSEWDTISCSTEHSSEKLYVRLDDEIPQGIAGLLQTNSGCFSNHWPVAVELVKDSNGLPKPIQLIATDGESTYV